MAGSIHFRNVVHRTSSQVFLQRRNRGSPPHHRSLNRAPLLLVLFGAWLPFLTILALLSKRHQFPFILAFIAGSVIFSLFIGDGHDVRIAELTTEQRAALKPASFADALKDWKAASGWTAKGCEQLPAGSPELGGCPRPIIVAGEGGGSRAAFLLASLLGAFETTAWTSRKIQQRGRFTSSFSPYRACLAVPSERPFSSAP